MDIKPIKRVWRGVEYDSQLEADWACTFAMWGMEHVYHPGTMVLSTGELWEPDFQLDEDIIFEVKGWHNERIEKAWTAASMGYRVVIGRAGLVPAGSDAEHAGAVWEPADRWMVVNKGSRIVFHDRDHAYVGSRPSWSADFAVEHGLDGIRWFKAVGEDGYA